VAKPKWTRIDRTPLVAVAIGGVAVAASEGVSVARLALDLLAAVLADRVVADEPDRPVGPKVADKETQQKRGQMQSRPLGLGEDFVVAGGSARAEPTQ